MLFQHNEDQIPLYPFLAYRDLNGRSLGNPEAGWHGSFATLLADVQKLMWSRFMCLGVRVQAVYVLQAHSPIA